MRLDYADGKLIVQHDPIIKMNDGLTVLDINTGEKLWHASYSSLEMKSSLSKTYFTPFPSPSPITVDGNTFVVDKLRNTLRCYDSQNGSLIWESKKYPDAQKIPTLAIIDGIVILAHGSPAIKVVRYEEKSNNSTRIRWKREYLNKDKYGLIAYDAKTGKVVWDGDQIGKKAKDKFQYVAGVEFIDGSCIVPPIKTFFYVDPKTGSVMKIIPVSKEN
ncbi:MAG: PQQ-binding-like beta-propeller repeat protein [Bacteroidales bacterium]|nr:PQQ-binding-like beta-propeller repeat protein [Bacteroidales bacterium]